MSEGSIAIRNTYVMLAYAFRAVRSDGEDSIQAESFEHLHDLFAEILIRGITTQIKRGLDRDYFDRSDSLTTVRGRIDITQTVGIRISGQRKLACEFDEYDVDTPLNRALKSVIVLLIRRSQVSVPRRAKLTRLLAHLDGVTLVAPASIDWGIFHFDRFNTSYRLLLGACELAVKGLLPTRDSGTTRLNSWLSDDRMSSLYERFLLEYYRLHHPEYSPSAPMIDWDISSDMGRGAEQLPRMRTDVTLRRGPNLLIIDAKYYGQSMQEWRGNRSIRSQHLYQILAYVKNADVQQQGLVSGLLLYARAQAPIHPDVDVVAQGNRIGAQALDLNLPWSELREQLDGVLDWV